MLYGEKMKENKRIYHFQNQVKNDRSAIDPLYSISGSGGNKSNLFALFIKSDHNTPPGVLLLLPRPAVAIHSSVICYLATEHTRGTLVRDCDLRSFSKVGGGGRVKL